MRPALIRCFPAGARTQRGVAAIELGIGMVLILLITAGIVEFGRAFWYYNALDKATRDAARYLSAVPAVEMKISASADAAIITAKDMVVAAVNSANVSPAITRANVVITCDASCGNPDATPVSVTVSITGFSILIGELFPFVSGSTDYGDIGLSPHTTMPYMN
jgi:Flp pilus assembly protein TadG